MYTGGRHPSTPYSKLRSPEAGPKQTAEGGLPKPPHSASSGDSDWSREGRGWTESRASFPDHLPPTMLPSSGDRGSQEKELPEGLSPELAPRLTSTLTPTLAASSGFPNRSQVWARCPGRKWGAGPRGGQHSRPTAPTPAGEHRHPPSSREGVGATHALPRSPYSEAPSGGSLQNQILSPTLLGIWSPLDSSHSFSTSALLPFPPCWRRRRRRRERLRELAISSRDRNEGAMHCAPIPGRRGQPEKAERIGPQSLSFS